MAAMLAPGDPLGADPARPIGLRVLRDRPFVLREPGSALRAVVMAACQAAGFSPVPLFEVGDPATVRLLAHAGLGVSVVPASWFGADGPEVARASLAAPGGAARRGAFRSIAAGGPGVVRMASRGEGFGALPPPGGTL